MEAQTSSRSNRNERRWELRELNLSVWDGATDVFPVAKSLDTSLKKNTAFIKRCRVSLVDDQQATLLKEVSTLSLEKYMSEVVVDFTEGLTRSKSTSDLFTGVEVASALHQRFGVTFSGALLANFLQGINNPDKRQLAGMTTDARAKEAAARTDRHKICLRVLIELWMVGVFRFTTDAMGAGFSIPNYAMKKTPNGNILPPPLSAIKEVLDYDMEEFSTSSIAIMLLKNYGALLVGLNKSSSKTEPQHSVVPQDMQAKFRVLFDAYTNSMQKRVIEVVKTTRRLERRNEDAFIRSGRVLEDRQEQYSSMFQLAEEMTGQCRILCDYLGMEMPEIRLTNETAEEILIRKGGTIFQGSDSGIWDDDEQRRFYEDLVDLTILVSKDRGSKSDSKDKGAESPSPPEGSEHASDDQKDENSEETNGDKGDDEEGDEEEEEEESEEDREILKQLSSLELNDKSRASLEAKPEGEEEEDGDEDDGEEFKHISNGSDDLQDGESVGQQMQAFLLKISAQTSREVIDEAAEEFLQLNNKASRNRIIKFLTDIPMADEYKLAFYARFIATLDPICPDITKGVVEYLNDFFKYLQKKRKIGALYQRRVFIVRYISEMTKFGLLEKHVIFNKFKMLTEKLDTPNIQSLSNLLEGCGRFLLRKPDTNILMTKMLQILERQKAAKYFTVDQRSLIDGALAYVKPDPDAQAIVKKKHRTVIEQFIRQLVYVELSKDSAKPVFQQLRMLDWDDADTNNALFKVFSKIHKVRYSNISSMAWFLNSLKENHWFFVVKVIDSLLEGIRRGLEMGTFSMNQQRIAQVKFLGELFAQNLVSHAVVYETLYLFITFGHQGGMPRRGVFSERDPPDEFFRIRLICTLLETPTVAKHLDGKDGKLDLYLAFLQYYMHTKDTLSMDVRFQIHDVFNLVRPKLKLHSNIKMAAKALDKAIARANGQPVEDNEEEGSDNDESKLENDEVEETEEERLEREEQERIKNLEAKRVHAQKEDLKASAEFERDFKKLMMDRLGNTNRASAPSTGKVFDEPLPTRDVLKGVQKKGAHEVIDMTKSSSGTANSDETRNRTAYTLLSKKGSKQQVTSLSIPSDSKFAMSVSQEQERLKAEHDVIKQRVLRYSQQSSDQDDTDLPSIKQPNLNSTKYTRKKGL